MKKFRSLLETSRVCDLKAHTVKKKVGWNGRKQKGESGRPENGRNQVPTKAIRGLGGRGGEEKN